MEDYTYDSYYYFFVKLIDEANKEEITLAEFREYKKALSLLKKVCDSLHIEGRVHMKYTQNIN